MATSPPNVYGLSQAPRPLSVAETRAGKLPKEPKLGQKEHGSVFEAAHRFWPARIRFGCEAQRIPAAVT